MLEITTSENDQTNKWVNMFELMEITDIVESKLQDKSHLHLVYEKELLESESAKMIFKPLADMF